MPARHKKPLLTERIAVESSDQLGDDVLLAALLSSGSSEEQGLSDARHLLPTGRIAELEFAVPADDTQKSRLLFAKASAFITLAERYHQQRKTTSDEAIKDAAGIARLFAFASEDRIERFYLLMLDSAGRVLGWRKVIEGDQTKIYFSPRLIVELALAHKAHRVAFVHNHPDGNARPSGNDHHAMQALYGICNSVGINVLDSVIVARNGYYSFADRATTGWAEDKLS